MADVIQEGLSRMGIGMPQINPGQWMTYAAFAMIGMVIVVAIIILIWQIYLRLSYNIPVVIHKEAGNNIVVDTTLDWVKKKTVGEDILFNYRNLKKNSPVFEDKYLRLIKYKDILGTKTRLGFVVYYKDGAINVMDYNKVVVQDEEGKISIADVYLSGIDYNKYNLIKSEVERIRLKHKRKDMLTEMAPYLLMLLIVVSWIIGNVIYGNHIEKVVTQILSYGQSTVAQSQTLLEQLIDKIGASQVVQ